jgi:ribonuclease P protein component
LPRSDAVAGARFPKSARLRKRREYLAVQETGTKVHGKHFVAVVTAPSESAPSGRAGITVSKKVGNAVTRNRIKRLVREALRHRRWVGCDVVIIAKPSAAGVGGADEVAAELDRLRTRGRSAAAR